MIEHMPVSRQAPGQFNNGAIQELRPVIYNYPGQGFHSYSNLFYWAHAWSDQGSTIGLHPHKGFEILSYVVEGSIEHYDTLLRKWIPLQQGAAQIIRSGNGVQHSEKLNPGARMFQIWFDPDLRKSLGVPASYEDFASDAFPVKEEIGIRKTILIGSGSPLEVQSPLRMERWDYAAGSHRVSIPSDDVLAWFQVYGEGMLGSVRLTQGDFARSWQEESLVFDSEKPGTAFLIFNPLNPGYRTYADQ